MEPLNTCCRYTGYTCQSMSKDQRRQLCFQGENASMYSGFSDMVNKLENKRNKMCILFFNLQKHYQSHFVFYSLLNVFYYPIAHVTFCVKFGIQHVQMTLYMEGRLDRAELNMKSVTRMYVRILHPRCISGRLEISEYTSVWNMSFI